MLIFGFFVGNRGPLRHDRRARTSPSLDPALRAQGDARGARESITCPSLFIVIGFGLIVLGAVVRLGAQACLMRRSN